MSIKTFVAMVATLCTLLVAGVQSAVAQASVDMTKHTLYTPQKGEMLSVVYEKMFGIPSNDEASRKMWEKTRDKNGNVIANIDRIYAGEIIYLVNPESALVPQLPTQTAATQGSTQGAADIGGVAEPTPTPVPAPQVGTQVPAATQKPSLPRVPTEETIVPTPGLGQGVGVTDDSLTGEFTPEFKFWFNVLAIAVLFGFLASTIIISKDNSWFWEQNEQLQRIAANKKKPKLELVTAKAETHKPTQNFWQNRTLDRFAESYRKQQAKNAAKKPKQLKKHKAWKPISELKQFWTQLTTRFAKPVARPTSAADFAKASAPWSDETLVPLPTAAAPVKTESLWLNAREPVSKPQPAKPASDAGNGVAKRPALRVVVDTERPQAKPLAREEMYVVVTRDIIDGDNASDEEFPVLIHYSELEQLFESPDGHLEKYTIPKLGAMIIDPGRPSFSTKFGFLVNHSKVTQDMKNNPEKIFVKVPGKGPYAPSNFANKAGTKELATA